MILRGDKSSVDGRYGPTMSSLSVGLPGISASARCRVARTHRVASVITAASAAQVPQKRIRKIVGDAGVEVASNFRGHARERRNGFIGFTGFLRPKHYPEVRDSAICFGVTANRVRLKVSVTLA